MTGSTTQPQPENVLGGALLALLAIPVGVIALTLLWSIGFIASIVGFLVAFSAFWLYRRGSGGTISRVGAWTITAIVVFTLAFGLWSPWWWISRVASVSSATSAHPTFGPSSMTTLVTS
jgi:hypothetical protein